VIARTLRGLAAAAVLAALLAGWPAALLAAGRAAAPWLPALGDPAGLLARPDPGGLFLLLVLALGWAAWAVWTAAVLVEAAAQVRGVPTPRLGGLFPQTAAAALVTAVAVAFATPAGTALAAPPAAAGPTNVAAAAGQDAGQPAAPSLRAYTVEPGDTLWGIAADQLADPHRWPQIAAASDDLPQPDGGHLTDPDLILPGWTLHLPPAAGPQPPPAPPAPPAAPASPEPTRPPGDPAPPEPAPPPAPAPEAPGLPRTPLQATTSPAPHPPPPPSPGQALPATPLANGRAPDPAGPSAAALVDDEGRSGPAHGVLGLPGWITAPLVPTRPEDAPDLVSALRGGAGR
jgi:hypothetical protein